jgi:hypothetical protein
MKESEFERRFLEFVYRTDLAITPAALAYHVDIPIAEATTHLEKLVARDVVKLDFGPNGDLLYSFPGRQKVTGNEAGAGRALSVVQVSGGTALAVVPSAPRPVLAVPGSDVASCPYCGESILAVAKKCKHCGEILDPTLRPAAGPLQVNVGFQPAVYRPRANAGVAALLTALFPGAGHIYCGEVAAGLGWFMATFLGYIALIVPGIIIHICCIVAASNTAKRMS